ncbi:ATP-binding protein [Actinomadura sp. ATCC 39365]
MTPGPSLGLRARLLFAFALLCVVTTAAVAGGLYVQARTDILQRAQDAALQATRGRMETLFPLRTPAPDRTELGRIAATMAERDSYAIAVYRERYEQAGPPSGPPPGLAGNPAPGSGGRDGNGPALKPEDLRPQALSVSLRRKVAEGEIAWQRVVREGRPFLIIGAPLLIAEGDRWRVSGIEVYTARSLLPEQRSIDWLATRAWLIGGAAMAFAVVVALLATRSVLRPVRELGRAARLLGEGELRARVEVRGSDELADVARTFNDTAAELERHVMQLREMEADARRFVADVSHELRTPPGRARRRRRGPRRRGGPAARARRPGGQAGQPGDAQPHRAGERPHRDQQVRLRRRGPVAERGGRGRAGARDAARPGLVGLGAHRASPSVTARLDPRRVDVILANLVGNALRHGEPPVSVRLSADPQWITLEVRDHGPGLAEAVLPHAFDRFFKASAARARSEGSGLGLAIAMENARLHRGDLTVANAPDGGALFTLRLPRRAPEQDGAAE